MRKIFFLSFFSIVFFSQISSVSATSCTDAQIPARTGFCAPSFDDCIPPTFAVLTNDCGTSNDVVCCITSSGSGSTSSTGSGSGFGSTSSGGSTSSTGSGSGSGSTPSGGSTSSTESGSGSGGGLNYCPEGFTVKAGTCFPLSETVGGLSSISVFDLVARVLNWLLGILGVLGVLAFVISGIQYLVSVGDEDLAKTAKRNITYTIIGLVVALAGLIIVNTIAGLTEVK